VAGSAAEPTTTRPQATGVLRGLAEVPIIVGLAVAIVVVLRAAVVQPFYIPSASMVPQLRINDKILVSRISYRLHEVHRGDLIVFSEPPGAKLEGPLSTSPTGLAGVWHSIGERLGLVPRTDELVKRVIALPGETVEAHDNHIFIDHRLLVEPYLPPDVVTSDFAPQTVPKGMLWVMGDNRQDSEDSRYFGPIRRGTVVGRAVLRIWPLTHFSFL
jgi:signal peptidase I